MWVVNVGWVEERNPTQTLNFINVGFPHVNPTYIYSYSDQIDKNPLFILGKNQIWELSQNEKDIPQETQI
ncbi:MAG: hypothetical protein RLZZ507_217 [Cyanobacteriota bacterium]|jgi:hypothetical protein